MRNGGATHKKIIKFHSRLKEKRIKELFLSSPRTQQNFGDFSEANLLLMDEEPTQEENTVHACVENLDLLI